MKCWFTPEIFHYLASNLSNFKWRLLSLSAAAFILYLLLELQVSEETPTLLIWLALAILFTALQILVFSSFIFFFQVLPSTKANKKSWYIFYRVIEWSETLLFALLLPSPTLGFIYAIFSLN
jgi:hypothetical protein|tara:strand:+ start:196 stop:561 length:366 start_codon:yes stop_codon:yes gene_type:complete